MEDSKLQNLDINQFQFESQASESYSPRFIRRSSLCSNLPLTPRILDKCNFVNQFEYNFLFQVLQKVYPNRTHNEIRFINDFIKKNLALKELSDINGKQFCKGIMRTAVFQEYDEHEIIQQKDSEANTVYIILEGKVGSIKNQDQTDMIQHISQREVYEILMNAARKESKKIGKLTRSFSSFREYDDHCDHQKYHLEGHEQFLEVFQKGQTFGDKVRCFAKEFTHTVITLQKTLLLSVDIKNVIFWLNHAFSLKLQKLYKYLNDHPFFTYLDNQTLEEIINYMSVHKRKKNEVIYEQGHQPSFIYFLEEGQLKIEKQCQLFVDNPNQLYIDRRKLMSSREINNKEYLPYANFEHLYNYRPISKTIELGILTPFALFGQEEIIQSKRRETTIRCSSLNAVYYSIGVRRIYQILNDHVGTFLQAVKTFIKDKIKYRQTSYATTINIQNKNHLKYFYCQGNQSLPTPRKYIIKKINQKISQNVSTKSIQKPKDSSSSVYTQSISDVNELNPQLKVPRMTYFDKEFQSSIPPFYNTFNFHKMLKTRLIKKELTKATLEQQDEEDAELPPNDSKISFKQQLKKQQKILADSHSWRLVKEKVKQQVKISKKIGSYKHDINFKTPLIDSKYFQGIESEMKRIERQRKAGKFNVSVPSRRRAPSFNSVHIEKK